MRTTAILLAAGLSERMGRSKPLLDWCGESLVRYQARQLIAGGVDDVLVVAGSEAASVEAELIGTAARVVHNPAYREGRATSVRAGALAIDEQPDAILLLNVDQPRHAALIREILAAHPARGAAITVPTYNGKRGHPVLLAGALLEELREVTEAGEGLRAVMRRHANERRQLEVDSPEVLLDVNDAETYMQAHSEWRKAGC